MSRDENVAVVESFLDCVARNELDRLPIAPGYTSESPMHSKLRGQAAVDYLRTVAGGLKGIRVIRHIAEGDYVATLFEEETIHGPLPVFAYFQIESGRVKDSRAFYDARQITGSADERAAQ